MKVSKEQSAQNREALLDAAGRLFKQHGVDGVGVADVCREAGLTHGALYKHFSDKQDLVAQAFSHAFRRGYDRVTRVRPGESPTLDTYLDRYLDRRRRDDPASTCPLVATACETGRQSEPVSQAFTDAFVELRNGLQKTLPPGSGSPETRARATLIVAALVGAMALSRGAGKAAPDLADEVLADVHKALEAMAGHPGRREQGAS